MAKTIMGTAINPSPVVVFESATAVTDARAKAFAITSGKAVLPTAGANVMGISEMETEESVAAGDDINIQIKDIGKWEAAEAIAVGDELATDATGKAKKATAGQFIVGVALTAATAAGSYVQVQITKSGYKPTATA